MICVMILDARCFGLDGEDDEDTIVFAEDDEVNHTTTTTGSRPRRGGVEQGYDHERGGCGRSC